MYLPRMPVSHPHISLLERLGWRPRAPARPRAARSGVVFLAPGRPRVSAPTSPPRERRRLRRGLRFSPRREQSEADLRGEREWRDSGGWGRPAPSPAPVSPNLPRSLRREGRQSPTAWNPAAPRPPRLRHSGRRAAPAPRPVAPPGAPRRFASTPAPVPRPALVAVPAPVSPGSSPPWSLDSLASLDIGTGPPPDAELLHAVTEISSSGELSMGSLPATGRPRPGSSSTINSDQGAADAPSHPGKQSSAAAGVRQQKSAADAVARSSSVHQSAPTAWGERRGRPAMMPRVRPAPASASWRRSVAERSASAWGKPEPAQAQALALDGAVMRPAPATRHDEFVAFQTRPPAARRLRILSNVTRRALGLAENADEASAGRRISDATPPRRSPRFRFYA